MLRAIREIVPTYVVGENVAGLLSWNGGLVFDEVQSDLEAEGYEVQPVILPACSVGAPHRRDRIWFVARNTKGNGAATQREVSSKRTGNQPCSNPIGTNPISGDDEKIRDVADTGLQRQTKRQEQPVGVKQLCKEQPSPDTEITGGPGQCKQKQGKVQPDGRDSCKIQPTWKEFPTQPPICSRNDGFSRPLVRYLTKEVYDEISKTSQENRIKDLSKVWDRVSQEEIWEKVRGFYSLESKNVLFQTMQLYQVRTKRQELLSPFCEDFSQPILSKLRKYGEFRRSPQGQELEKQRTKQLGDIVSYLPHEIPLAARAFEGAMAKFEAKHRNESIKAYGNAIVPQIAYEIFKSIAYLESL